MYLIQGIRHARIDIDQKLVEIGLNENAIDPSSTIHRSLEWDVLEFFGESINQSKVWLLVSTIHSLVMGLYSCYLWRVIVFRNLLKKDWNIAG